MAVPYDIDLSVISYQSNMYFHLTLIIIYVTLLINKSLDKITPCAEDMQNVLSSSYRLILYLLAYESGSTGGSLRALHETSSPYSSKNVVTSCHGTWPSSRKKYSNATASFGQEIIKMYTYL